MTDQHFGQLKSLAAFIGAYSSFAALLVGLLAYLSVSRSASRIVFLLDCLSSKVLPTRERLLWLSTIHRRLASVSSEISCRKSPQFRELERIHGTL